MEFVLDCSLTTTWFFQDEYTPFTTAVRRSLGENSTAYVPSIWPIEVSNVLLVSERKKRITPSHTDLFLFQLRQLPIHIDVPPSQIIINDIITLARKHLLSAYDGEYLELAIRRKLPLASLDKELIKAARKSGVKILDHNSFLK